MNDPTACNGAIPPGEAITVELSAEDSARNTLAALGGSNGNRHYPAVITVAPFSPMDTSPIDGKKFLAWDTDSRCWQLCARYPHLEGECLYDHGMCEERELSEFLCWRAMPGPPPGETMRAEK